MRTQRPDGKLWRATLWLAAAGGWLALAWSLASPSEAENALFLGYSGMRLLSAAWLLSLSLFFSFQLLKKADWSSRQLLGPLTAPKLFPLAFVINGLFLLFTLTLLLLPEQRAAAWFGLAAGYLPRLAPLLAYGGWLAGLLAVWLLIERYGMDTAALWADRSLLSRAAWILAALLGFWVGIGLTGIGLGFDLTEWNAPGAPLLIDQVFLVCILALAGTALAAWLGRRGRQRRLDAALFFIIWAGASLLWLAQPAEPNYYSAPPVAPNFEPYPLSDAFNHDTIASNLLNGEGFRFGGLRVIRKPLYAAFLAGLHLMAGDNYHALINGQVVLLALFPATLYLLGHRLHSRLAGLLLAGLVTLREANAIQLGDVINLSHAKLLMADLPAALGLALFALLAFYWLSRHPGAAWIALATGGAAGFLLLVRSQNLTLLPGILLLTLLALRHAGMDWRTLSTRLVLFALGAALAVGPWLLRNHSLTGEWIIEQSTAAAFLAQRYSEAPNELSTAFLPGETEGQYYARHIGQVKAYVLQHPGEVAAFVADNYVRNLYLTVMPLPLSFNLRTLENHVRELPYWPSWDGQLLPESWLPLALNLALIALGLAAAWRRWGWPGLTPLAINLGFTLNLALARVSGWRYNQPVDWTLILYFALGLAQVFLWAFGLLGRHPWLAGTEGVPVSSGRLSSWRATMLAGVVVLALGCAPLAAEALIPQLHQRPETGEVQEQLEQIKASPALLESLAGGQITVLRGAALYPRHYQAGEGIIGSDFLLTAPRSFERLTFFLIGPDPGGILLPVEGAVRDFQSGDAVMVFQCEARKDRVLAVLHLETHRLYIGVEQDCGGL